MTLHPAALDVDVLRRACDVQTTRRSGPGGQHRNKVETAVVVTHRPTGLRGQASERRSQSLNAAAAWHRLRVQLALQIRMPRERGGQPSELWLKRAKTGIARINPEHADFPALLAEALDALAAHDQDLPESAAELCVSTSQLMKFLKLEPAAWEQTNCRRGELGLPRLK